MSDIGMLPISAGGIGEFEVGGRWIGDVPFNWANTLISQYANSPNLTFLLALFSAAAQEEDNISEFYTDVWNITTATGYGLDVWGRILGVGRTLEVATGDYFGFNEAGAQAQPFGQGQFYSFGPVTSNYELTDAPFLTLLLAKAAANICDGTIPSINQLLLNLFPGRGNCFVQEGFADTAVFFGFEEAGTVNQEGFNNAPFYAGQSFSPMSIVYVFQFLLSAVEFAILEQSGVLPTPCGVSYSIVST